MDTNTDAQALTNQTHPERLVRRGWQGQAGVRSTWPPPLTAPLLKVPIEVSLLLANARIGCFLYGTVPSTAPLFPQDHKYSCCCRCCWKNLSEAKEKKKQQNIRVSCGELFRQMSSLFISRNNGRLFFQYRNTTDGCTTALSCSCVVLMALWASSCHQVTGCKLLSLQSSELIPGAINQTLRRCEPLNVFLDFLWLFAHQCVNSPTLPTNHSHRATRREWRSARCFGILRTMHVFAV